VSPRPVGAAVAVDPLAGDADLALELRDVHAAYGAITVLRGFDLAVPFGSIVALLGPNGGGKTTALRVVAGQLGVRHGDVLLAGRRVNGADPDEISRRGVCLIPEGRGIFPNLSVRENLWMATHTGVPRRAIEEVAYARFAPLGARRKQLAGTLSGGEQQMLSMARALAVDPALLLLDELSMGLAPLVVEQLYEIVAGVAREGVAIVVVEQFARAILGIADSVGIVVRGRVTTFGAPAEVEAELSSAYLGE
jgi:branched-chain amino acid transport system ATP-binding protein